jgi:hypothetical protein
MLKKLLVVTALVTGPVLLLAQGQQSTPTTTQAARRPTAPAIRSGRATPS